MNVILVFKNKQFYLLHTDLFFSFSALLMVSLWSIYGEKLFGFQKIHFYVSLSEASTGDMKKANAPPHPYRDMFTPPLIPQV